MLILNMISMKTSKITHIEGKGTWSNGQKTFNRYQVSFANGDNPIFLATGEFKKSVGDEATYNIKDEKYNTAKLVYEQPAPRGVSGGMSKDQQIIRQTVIKAASEFNAKRSVGSEQVIKDAELFLNWINNG